MIEINPRDMATEWGLSLDPAGRPIAQMFRLDHYHGKPEPEPAEHEITASLEFVESRTARDVMDYVARTWPDSRIEDVTYEPPHQFSFWAVEKTGDKTRFRATLA
jgi:hypothetical protein